MKRLLWLLPLPIALLVRFIFQQSPETAERVFSTGIYPALAAPISRLMALCPIPIIELLAVLFILFILISLFKKKFFRVTAACGMVAALFFGGWGLAYLRLPLEQTLGLSVQPSAVAELAALCETLSQDANAYHADPPGDILALVPAALDQAAATWPIPAGRFAAPKYALTSPLLSRFLIEGITSPFTLEALVTRGIPALSLPYVACHEAAHVRGFAREEDANLIAYLACMASDDVYFRYSGSVSALTHCLSALRGADPEAYQACYAALSGEVRADLAAHSAYWAAFRQSRAAEVAASVNNAYLGAVSAGDQSTRSYGRVVDLLLALQTKGRDSEAAAP